MGTGSNDAPRAGRSSFSLGSTAATATYWTCVALLIAALFRTRLLPLVDYPQHLAIAATLKRIWTGGVAERALYETNLLGYNSLFHASVATLGIAVPLELAGKLVIAAYVVVFALASIALLDATERPRSRALLLLPLAVGYSFALGFLNYCLGLAIQLVVLSRILRALRDLPEQPSWRAQLTTAALALLGVYAHVLASAAIYALLMLVVLAHSFGPARAAPRVLCRVFAPIAPSALYGAVVFGLQGATRVQNPHYVSFEGRTVTLGKKLSSFLQFASGLRADRVDELFVAAALALLAFAALRPQASAGRRPPFRIAMLVGSVGLYLALPHYFFSSTFIFGRMAILVVIALAILAPAPRPPFARPLAIGAGVICACSALSFVQSMNAARAELADLESVLVAAPSDRRLLGLVFAPKLASFRARAVLHAPAYYMVLHPGEVAFMFDTLNLPLRRRSDRAPQLPELFELNPHLFDATAPYATVYDLALVRSLREGEDPRTLVWGAGGAQMPVVEHRGSWWLVDTRAAR